MSTIMDFEDLQLFGDRVLKVVAFIFLIGNGIATFFLSHSFHKQFESNTPSSSRWESNVDFLANSDSVYDDQKLELLLLGIFTLVLMLANIFRGSMIQVCELGPFIVSSGYLCSGILFLVMRSTICDDDCLNDIMEDSEDRLAETPKHLYDKFEDKVLTLLICSIIAGIGFYVAIIGYFLVWTEKTIQIIKLVVFFGLNAVAIGFIGAFVKYWYLIHKYDDGEYSLPAAKDDKFQSADSDDFDDAQNHVTGFLILSGIGFVLAGIGELASIYTIDVDDKSEGDVEDPVKADTGVHL